MYINSTNIILSIPDNTVSFTPNWITSEKYHNCEDFYPSLNQHQKRRRLFERKAAK